MLLSPPGSSRWREVGRRRRRLTGRGTVQCRGLLSRGRRRRRLFIGGLRLLVLLIHWLRLLVLLIGRLGFLVLLIGRLGLLIGREGLRLLLHLARADLLGLDGLERQVLAVTLPVAVSEVAGLPGGLEERVRERQ